MKKRRSHNTSLSSSTEKANLPSDTLAQGRKIETQVFSIPIPPSGLEDLDNLSQNNNNVISIRYDFGEDNNDNEEVHLSRGFQFRQVSTKKSRKSHRGNPIHTAILKAGETTQFFLPQSPTKGQIEAVPSTTKEIIFREIGFEPIRKAQNAEGERSEDHSQGSTEADSNSSQLIISYLTSPSKGESTPEHDVENDTDDDKFKLDDDDNDNKLALDEKDEFEKVEGHFTTADLESVPEGVDTKVTVDKIDEESSSSEDLDVGSHLDSDSDEQETEEGSSSSSTEDSSESDYFQTIRDSIKANNGIWSRYGISMDETLESKRGKSADDLFDKDVLEKLSPVEVRVKIHGQKFKIVENQSLTDSLYRSISLSASGSEENYRYIKSEILSEIITNWRQYLEDIGEDCGFQSSLIDLKKKKSDPDILLQRFKDYFLSKYRSGSSLFEIKAAGRRFGFNFITFDARDFNGKVTIRNSDNSYILKKSPGLVYHFLRTGSIPDSWYYQYLIPIGPPQSMKDGEGSIFIYKVILVDQQANKGSPPSSPTKKKIDPCSQFPKHPAIALGLDHRTFLYKPTHTHDLFSLLAELLFKRLSFAPQIYQSAAETKVYDTQFYHFSKLRKRQRKGHGKDAKMISQYFNTLKTPHNHRGDVVDLESAANFLGFSYTLIGLDGNLNFFWKESIKDTHSSLKAALRFAFLLIMSTNREPNWFALEDAGWECLLEQGLYQGINFRDNTPLRRKLYHPTSPCLYLSDVTVLKNPDRWELFYSKANAGIIWLSNGLTDILVRSRILAGAQCASRVSVDLCNILRRLFHKKVRIRPDNTTLTELYFRDHP